MKRSPVWMGPYTLGAIVAMVGFFIAGAIVVNLKVDIPVFSLLILAFAALIAGGRYTVVWFRGLSPTVLIDGLGLRESTNRFVPLAATTDEHEQISGFPATILLNVGGYKVPGLSGPNHNLIEGPKSSFEKLNEKLAIFYIAAVPVPDRVYRGYTAVTHDISMKNPHSGYVPDYGRVWVGMLDTRTREANQYNMRLFDTIMSTFGTLLGDDRDVVRGGMERKNEMLKAMSKGIRRKTASERLARFFEPQEGRTNVAYKEVEEGRKD